MISLDLIKLVEEPLLNYLLTGVNDGSLIWDISPNDSKYTVIPYGFPPEPTLRFPHSAYEGITK